MHFGFNDKMGEVFFSGKYIHYTKLSLKNNAERQHLFKIMSQYFCLLLERALTIIRVR